MPPRSWTRCPPRGKRDYPSSTVSRCGGPAATGLELVRRARELAPWAIPLGRPAAAARRRAAAIGPLGAVLLGGSPRAALVRRRSCGRRRSRRRARSDASRALPAGWRGAVTGAAGAGVPESAIARDSCPPTRARTRARLQLPGMRPTRLPTRFLTGRAGGAAHVAAPPGSGRDAALRPARRRARRADTLELDAEIADEASRSRCGSSSRCSWTNRPPDRERPSRTRRPARCPTARRRRQSPREHVALPPRPAPRQSRGCWATLELTLES